MPDSNSQSGSVSRRCFLRVLSHGSLALSSVAVVLLAGCGGQGGGGVELQGKVVFNGKGVYPGTIIMRDGEGQTISSNLTATGEFTLRGVKETSYTAAIQTQKLGGLSGRAAAQAAQRASEAEAGAPKRREDTIPDKFKNANVDIPEKYESFEDSGLSYDFSSGVPDTPLEINLD